MNRRNFINRSAMIALSPAVSFLINKSYGSSLSAFLEETDETICGQKFSFAAANGFENRPIAEVIVGIGRSFIGTEYAEHSLEEAGPEHLVVNLRKLDCVTFYENSLAIARCIKLKKTTYDDFKAQLQWMRYRGGVINGYSSRLHYTTDYWFDDEQRGILKVVTKELFGEKNVQRIPTPINFMSAHRGLYAQLADENTYAAIKKREHDLSNREMFFLPKGNLHLYAESIKSGSLIGITTNIPGLDISHTGIAVRTENGSLHLMHAPDVGEKVQITKATLHDYLARNPRQTGIIVAEAFEPK